MPPGSGFGSGTTDLEVVPVGEGKRGTCEIKQHLQTDKDVALLVISILHYFIFAHALLNHAVSLR